MTKAQVVPGEADTEVNAVREHGAAYAQWRASQVDPMRAAVTVNVAPPRPLPAAAGQLAHDLRGALQLICGHAELLAEKATDEEARASSRCIIEAGARLASLCDDLLDLLQ